MATFRVLGGVDLRTDLAGECADVLKRQKCLALLTYLALEGPGVFLRRDKVATLFWPELDQKHARAALRKSLHFLRSALGAPALPGLGSEEIALDPAHVECDAVSFREALADDRLEEALELYGGDLLDAFILGDCHDFDHWLHLRRTSLREEAADAAWTLAARRIDEGAVPQAERWAQRALELHDVDEVRVQRFIQALDEAGDRAAALRFYERFETLLADELELSPSPETRRAVEEIRDRESAWPPAMPPPATEAPAAPPPAGRWPFEPDRPPIDLPATPRPSPAATAKHDLRRTPWIPAALGGLGLLAVSLRFAGAEADRGPPVLSILPPEVSGSATMEMAEGLTDAIYQRLVVVRGLTILANYTRSQYDPVGKTYPEIGADLDADYVLEVRLTGNAGGPKGASASVSDLIVRADLIRASTGEGVWSLPSGESATSIMELQSTIARRIVEELDLRLSERERDAVAQIPTRNEKAWRLLEEAKRVNNSGPSWASEAAIPLLQKAVAEDSTFVEAWLGLGVAYSAAGDVDGAQDAYATARRLDPDHPSLRYHEGAIAYGRGQYERAFEVWNRMLAERPSAAGLQNNVGIALRQLGRWEEALPYLRRVTDLDPFDAGNRWALSEHLMRMREYAEAEVHLDRYEDLIQDEPVAANRVGVAIRRAWLRIVADGDTLSARRVVEAAADELGWDVVMGRVAYRDQARIWLPLLGERIREEVRSRPLHDLNLHPSFYYMARATLEQEAGRTEVARAYYDSVFVSLDDRRPWSPGQLGSLAIAAAGLGRSEEAVRLAEEGLRARPVESTRDGTVSLWYLARVLVMVGDHDRAVETLERLLSVPSFYSTTWLRIHPFFDPLREHPRFQSLVEDGSAPAPPS